MFHYAKYCVYIVYCVIFLKALFQDIPLKQ